MAATNTSHRCIISIGFELCKFLLTDPLQQQQKDEVTIIKGVQFNSSHRPIFTSNVSCATKHKTHLDSEPINAVKSRIASFRRLSASLHASFSCDRIAALMRASWCARHERNELVTPCCRSRSHSPRQHYCISYSRSNSFKLYTHKHKVNFHYSDWVAVQLTMLYNKSTACCQQIRLLHSKSDKKKSNKLICWTTSWRVKMLHGESACQTVDTANQCGGNYHRLAVQHL